MRTQLSAGGLALALVAGLATACASPQLEVRTGNDPLVEVTGFGSNPGNLRMFTYTPRNLRDGAPLVVVVHGCASDAHEIAAQSGWLELADRYGFAVLLPQTSIVNEPLGGCFRTWEPGHQARGAGEPLSIMQMIKYVERHQRTSHQRTFITGVSSGGHVVGVMLATYPDLFAAGAPQSSFPYRCATSFSDLAACAQGRVTKTPDEWGDLVRDAYPEYGGPRPRVEIWHGSADELISPLGLEQLSMQWRNVHGSAGPAIAGAIQGYPLAEYRDSSEMVVVATVSVTGMGHALAVDPGEDTEQCGTPGEYASDVDICAAYWIGRFFGVVPAAPFDPLPRIRPSRAPHSAQAGAVICGWPLRCKG